MAVGTLKSRPDHSSSHQVVVIGAGYAGVIATNRILSSRTLAERQSVRVTVVNPRTDFVERIRLHEVAAGTVASATFPLSDILHQEAELVAGTAIQIDPDARVVDVERDGVIHPIPYNTLVYAVGSKSAVAVPGVRDHAVPLAGIDDADRARHVIARLAAGSLVTVVGGGLTGVEVVTELAERRPDLSMTLVTSGTVVAKLSDAGRRNVKRVLNWLGIEVIEGAQVESITTGRLDLADHRQLAFDACVWTVGFTVPDLALRSGLATDAIGRLRLDATLTSIDSPHIVGAGDAIVIPDAIGRHLRMSCAAAVPLGGHAADTILARIRGTDVNPLSLGYAGQCISLGRHRGLMQLVHADDTPRRLIVPGPAGAWVKERVCRYTVTVMRNERRRPSAMLGFAGPSTCATHEPELSR
jgi:NADH dehydrogenase